LIQYLNKKKYIYLFIIFLCILCGCKNLNLNKNLKPNRVVKHNHNNVSDLFNYIVKINLNLSHKKIIKKVATGSGILVSEKYIITCNHIFKNYNIKYSFDIIYQGQNMCAKYIGGDEDNDIALLKICDNPKYGQILKNYKPPNIIKRHPILGEKVYCIGFLKNIFQRDNFPSLTGGIISFVNRKIEVNNNQQQTFIQVDAYANQGSSGGGLFSSSMELIGIISLVLQKKNGQWEGVTLVIPIQKAYSIAKKILKKSKAIL